MPKRWKMVHGNTHSRNAQSSEAGGEMPITRAVDAVYKSMDCKSSGISRREVREFLVRCCARGWHHIAGPSGVREVNYYTTVLSPPQKEELLKLRKK
jgi:hypothetical protein